MGQNGVKLREINFRPNYQVLYIDGKEINTLEDMRD